MNQKYIWMGGFCLEKRRDCHLTLHLVAIRETIQWEKIMAMILAEEGPVNNLRSYRMKESYDIRAVLHRGSLIHG